MSELSATRTFKQVAATVCFEPKPKVLFQPVFGALAGVDGAAGPLHDLSFFKPKNRGPLHSAPVIRLATALSDA